jgi:hypothetical protein
VADVLSLNNCPHVVSKHKIISSKKISVIRRLVQADPTKKAQIFDRQKFCTVKPAHLFSGNGRKVGTQFGRFQEKSITIWPVEVLVDVYILIIF